MNGTVSGLIYVGLLYWLIASLLVRFLLVVVATYSFGVGGGGIYGRESDVMAGFDIEVTQG